MESFVDVEKLGDGVAEEDGVAEDDGVAEEEGEVVQEADGDNDGEAWGIPFSYHSNKSPSNITPTTSKSPSPSISSTHALKAPSRPSAITISLLNVPFPWFSYQTTLLSLLEVATTSQSPSPSRSPPPHTPSPSQSVGYN